jgi:hypothetical protein
MSGNAAAPATALNNSSSSSNKQLLAAISAAPTTTATLHEHGARLNGAAGGMGRLQYSGNKCKDEELFELIYDIIFYRCGAIISAVCTLCRTMPSLVHSTVRI